MSVVCERLAAYILISTVALMLCERYGIAQAQALRIIGLVNAAGYLGTLGGGFLSDRVLGPRRGMWLGMLFLTLGYTMLSISSSRFLFAAFGFLTIGCSLFKPGMQTVVARLYPPKDQRIDAAQVILYLSANAGAMAGTILAGLTVRWAGYGVTYLLAALAVAIGVVYISLNLTALRLRSVLPAPIQTVAEEPQTLSSTQRLFSIAILAIAMLLFALCTAQAEGALLLFAKQRVNRMLLGFEIPVGWLLAYPAFFALLLGPTQLAVLNKLQRGIGTYRLVAIGLLFVAGSFAILIPPAFDIATQITLRWIAASLSLFVVGELCVAPLGLSLLLRLAPSRFTGFVVGIWYCAGSLGYLLAGEIGSLWTRWSPDRVLGLLSVLPLLGAALLWWVQPKPPHG